MDIMPSSSAGSTISQASSSSHSASPRSLASRGREHFRRRRVAAFSSPENEATTMEETEMSTPVERATESYSSTTQTGAEFASHENQPPEISPGVANKTFSAATIGRTNSTGKDNIQQPDIVRSNVEKGDECPPPSVLHIQASSSTEATPDPETLLNVQAFIETIHNRCSEDSTAPESSGSSSHHHYHTLHLVQSNDEEHEIVVDAQVISSIGKYIDTLTAAESNSLDHEASTVSHDMLSLVQQWIEHLPPPPKQRSSVKGASFDTTTVVEVDPKTMEAVEACMEWVEKKHHKSPSWHGRHHQDNSTVITVAAATVTETPSLSGSRAPTLASDETGGSGEDNNIAHADSFVSDGATRGRVCAISSAASETPLSSAPPALSHSFVSTSTSPVHSAVNFGEQKTAATAKSPVNESLLSKAVKSSPSFRSMASYSKSSVVANETSTNKIVDAGRENAKTDDRLAETEIGSMSSEDSTRQQEAGRSVVPDAFSFHSTAVMSQDSAAPIDEVALAPSYRSYGHSSSSSSSGGTSKVISKIAPDGVTSEGATDSVAGPDIIDVGSCNPSSRSADLPDTKLIIKRVETGKTLESGVLSGQDDRGTVHSIDQDGKPPSANHVFSSKSVTSNISNSVDARIRGLIDAVGEWGGDGSFLEYTAMHGGSLDSGALEALKELVIDAESSYSAAEDQSSVDEIQVPEELGEELKHFIDAYRTRKTGHAIEIPSSSIRVKKDPPASEPQIDSKEDPPINNTFSHELTRWMSGNEDPEPNPEKESPPADPLHLDPECNQPLMRALSEELLARKHTTHKNHLHPGVPPRPPSLTPDESMQSSHAEESLGHIRSVVGNSCGPASPVTTSELPHRKSPPPRPEISLSPRHMYEEKKEDSIILDSHDCPSSQGDDAVTDRSPGEDGKPGSTADEHIPRASSPLSRASSPPPKPETPPAIGNINRRPPRSPRAQRGSSAADVLLSSKVFDRIASRLIDGDCNSKDRLALSHLVRCAFADVKQGKMPDAMSKRYKGLSSGTVQSFVDAVAHSQKHSELAAIPSEELQTMKAGKTRNGNSSYDKEMLVFAEQIATAIENIDEKIPLDFIVGPTDSEANGIEYDINSGYVRQVHAAHQAEAEEVPWWEATAKLAVVSMDMLDGAGDNADESENSTTSEDATDTNTASYSGSTSRKADSSQSQPRNDNRDKGGVEDDIDDFWKSQQELRERRMKFRDSPKKEKLAELPHIHITSYSYNSQTSAQSAHSGSYSKTTIFSKTTAESLDTLDERWLLKRSMAGHGLWSRPQWLASNKETVLDVDTPEPINGTEASSSILDISCRWREQRNSVFSSHWALSYEKRSFPHSGYQGVDIHSLADSSKVSGEQAHRLDNIPWEKREVKQYFLHEQSMVNRNWFGKLKRYSSVTVDMPVCKPRSMEMPVKVDEWTEDWYRIPALRSLGTNLSGSAAVSGDGDASEYYRKYVQSEDDLSEEEDWEDTPECGTLKNVKLKPGERISRVTPDLTSSLRRSRWRKKFFPKGTFPY